MQSAGATAKLPTILLVPLTTQLDALRFPGTALVEATTRNGLTRPSVALVFQLAAVDRMFVGQEIGTLSQSASEAVWLALGDIMPRP
jgi:mRNA-degrading endonuclease toxin of MazEF toxin-antitoxin module